MVSGPISRPQAPQVRLARSGTRDVLTERPVGSRAQTPGLVDMVVGALRNWWVIVAFLSLGALAGQFVLQARTVWYQASARIEILPSPADPRPVPDLKAEAAALQSESLVRASAAALAPAPDVDEILDHLEVRPNDRSGQLLVVVRAHDAVAARDVAASIARTYVDRRNVQAAQSADRSVETLRNELTAVRARIAAVGAERQTLEAERITLQSTLATRASPRTAEIEARLGTLNAQYSNDLARASQLDVQLTTVTIQATSRAPAAAIVANPSVPTEPLGTPQIVVFLLTVLGVGAVGFVAAFGLWRRTVASEEHAQSMGRTVLAAVPSGAPAVGRADGNSDDASEQFTKLCMTTLHQLSRHGRTSLLVVPATPEEARSDVAVRMATTYARLGRRTALVSAATSRPDLAARFGLPSGRGLSEALVEGTPLELEPVPGTPNLVVAGFGHDHAARDLLGSAPMRQLVIDLEAHFDILVIEGPTLSSDGDLLAVASLSASSLVVVNERQRGSALVASGCRDLENAGSEVLGLVGITN